MKVYIVSELLTWRASCRIGVYATYELARHVKLSYENNGCIMIEEVEVKGANA